MIIWLTGLSGSGKSTLAEGLALSLKQRGYHPLMLDGDILRKVLCSDLGFSEKDRAENVRRAASIALIAAESGITSICALISPLRRDRDQLRARCREQKIPFLEVYVAAPLDICETRDPKGLYRKARAGIIPDFTGIDSPYEPPLDPDLLIPTGHLSSEESIRLLEAAVMQLLGDIT